MIYARNSLGWLYCQIDALWKAKFLDSLAKCTNLIYFTLISSSWDDLVCPTVILLNSTLFLLPFLRFHLLIPEEYLKCHWAF